MESPIVGYLDVWLYTQVLINTVNEGMSFTEYAIEQIVQLQSHKGNEHYGLDPYVEYWG